MSVTQPGKIHAAMLAVMKALGPIAKDSRNTQQGYNFRGIDDIYNHIQSVLADNGVYSLPRVLERVTEERPSKSGGLNIWRCLTVEYTFFAEDGSKVSCVVVSEGMDNGDKASNKAMASADKYALVQAFKIKTAEVKDPEADDHARNRAEAALASPDVRWDNAVKAFAAYSVTERQMLNKVKRPDPKSVTEQDHELLLSWYGELERGAQTA